MTNPKVCIFTETYYPVVGGGERQARTLAKALSDDGSQVTVLTRRSDAAFRSIERIDGATVYRLPPAGSKHLNKWGLLLTCMPWLYGQREAYDLIFVSGFRVVGIGAVIAAKLLGKKCVLKADSLGEMSGAFFADGLKKLRLTPENPLFKFFLSMRNHILCQADAFVAISSEVSTELECCGVNPAMTYTIPNSVDTEKYRPVDQDEKQAIRRRLGLEPGCTYVIYTGRLVSYKGLPLLLRVWRELSPGHKQSKLLLVGSGGLDIHDCEDELKAFVINNRLNDSVMFTGEVENVQEYLQASDIFVFPTENEAFGIALIEAMATGLPVIATRVGGLKDILEQGRNGLGVKAGDFKELFDALDTLMTESSRREHLGLSARHTAMAAYADEIVFANYRILFAHLMNNQKTG
jgi:glycosyltransferase involved in cell wall biosynthesis